MSKVIQPSTSQQKFRNYQDRVVIPNFLETTIDFPPHYDYLHFYTKFETFVDGSTYFRDLGPLGLHAKAVDSCTALDSIQLNNDIRIQLDCSAAGCFNQFFDGSIAVVGNSVKTVKLSDLSQLYLDNYMFSNIDRNLFMIYDREQTGNKLNLVLDRVGARVKKLSEWGIIESGVASIWAIKTSNDHIVSITTDNNYVIDFNIRNKTYETFGVYTPSTTSYIQGWLLPNSHIVSFPYNVTQILDINPSLKTINLIGDFSAFAIGRFSSGCQCIIESDNSIISFPRTVSSIVKYNYIDATVEIFGSLTDTNGNDKFIGCVKISDNLLVGIPGGYNKVINFDPINETIDTPYGSIGTTTLKFASFYKINDDLICCVPRNAAFIANIIPSTKTVETYGTFSGTTQYLSSILLSNGHIFAVPASSTKFLDINPISKTYIEWGNLSGSNKYFSKLIELSNGHILAFPYSSNYLIDIDPINQTYENIYDFGTSTAKFGGLQINIAELSSNQILAIPLRFYNIIDYNKNSNDIFRLGYFGSATTTERFSRNELIYDSNKRILIPKDYVHGILDIELR